MPALTLDEARARAELLHVDTYAIDLDLSQGGETYRCRTTVTFDCRAPGAGTFIDLAGAREVHAVLNGHQLHGYADDRLVLPGLEAHNELVVEAAMPYVTTGDGMHRMTDPADGHTYVSAYCGMDVARTVFACFDQPDLKAAIDLSVSADPEWTVVANGVATHEGEGRWRFATTPRVSTYLFVMCAGPWHSVTWEHAGLPFGWHARASLADALDAQADELRRITECCFDHYTQVFDEPYPFDSYDQVMAPGQNWGALETPGCVTYRDELLFRGRPTAAERMSQATVVAHEMAHMWFGNLVTMRWWEDTWLNESFADFMGYEVAAEAAGYDLAWASCAVGRKPTAYRADSRRSTHPVAPLAEDVVDVDTAMANFDMITYAKGNALLRQLQAWLGRDAFLAGTNRHLTQHAFDNATLADYLDSLDACTDRDVRAWADAWLLTTGFDTVEVLRDGDVPVLRRVGTRPHRLTASVLGDDGVLTDEHQVDLAEADVRLEGLAGHAVVVNAHDEAYVRVRLDDLSLAAVAQRLSTVTSPLTRGQLYAGAADMVLDGSVPWGWLAEVVSEHLSHERESLLFSGMLSLVVRSVVPLLAPEDAQELTGSLVDVCRAALEVDDARRETAGRFVAGATDDVAWLRRLLASTSGLGADPEARWAAVRRLVELGESVGVVDDEAARDRSEQGRLAALAATAAEPTAEAKQATWERMVDAGTSNRELVALGEGLWRPGQLGLVRPYLEAYVDQMPALARERGQGYASVIGRVFPVLPLPTADARRLRDTADAAAAKGEGGPVLARAWRDRVDDLDVALRLR